MAATVRPTTNEYEKKKAAIGAVIDFNDANDIKYSRVKLFKHFGVSAFAGYAWFPVPKGPDGGKPGRGRPRSTKKGVKIETSVADNLTKWPRSNSENSKNDHQNGNIDNQAVIKAGPDEPTSFTTPRQNPIRNAGRGRKRLKTVVDVLNDSVAFTTPPPPSAELISPPSTAKTGSTLSEGLITPPSRKRGRPRKAVVEAQELESQEEMFHSDADFDDDDLFEV